MADFKKADEWIRTGSNIYNRNPNGTVNTTTILPLTTASYDLGAGGKTWANIYYSNLQGANILNSNVLQTVFFDTAQGVDISVRARDAGNVYRTAMTISNTNARVGIGATIPGDQLEVKGDAGLIIHNFDTASSYGGFGLQQGGATKGYMILMGTTFAAPRTNTFEFNSAAGTDFTWRPANAEAMRILSSNGNVGIGTASPGTLLEVAGVATATSFIGNAPASTSYLSGALAVGLAAVSTGVKIQLRGGPVYQDQTGVNAYLMNGAVNYGGIGNTTGDTWSLGYTAAVGTVITPALTWTGSTRVGIGTTSPNMTLSVSGVSALNNPNFLATNVPSDAAVILGGSKSIYGVNASNDTAEQIIGFDSANGQVKIDTNGNSTIFGAGLTAAGIILGSKITTNRIECNVNGADGNYSGFRAVGTSNADWFIFTNTSTFGGNQDSLAFYKNAGTNTTKMVIQDNGWVGVGTTAPLGQLHVLGAGGADGLRVYATTNNSPGLVFGNVTSGLLSQIYSTVIKDIRLNTGNDALVVLANGNVGIGVGTPLAHLHLTSGTTVLRVDASGVKPTTNETLTLGVSIPLIGSVLGGSILGDPGMWLNINISGTNYKIPCYT